ncbi:MAG: FliI/YscN family ATPase [Planctomycetia bacterium]|nr:FliI/YscN family ATPase [Planctomycetia bacterium]
MNQIYEQIHSVMPVRLEGTVVRTDALTIAAESFPAPIGAIATIDRKDAVPLQAEVIAFHGDETVLYSYSDTTGIHRGSRIRLARTVPWLEVGDKLLGRVVNAFGKAIDRQPQPILHNRVRYDRAAPAPCDRPPISEPLATGIRAIDGLLTCGCGQRCGIFAGSGVGKSMTLGMMARYTSADVNVIALIGERGLEVNDFLTKVLGEQGRQKSVVVVATSDEPALMRVRAASAAMSIAEYFRDQGKNVLFLMDSITRLAMAKRELGLAAGEPATTKGYPPGVFSMLPRLLERAGRTNHGSITGFFTVLVEGDDKQDPICDAVRGLLDGHIWLSRKLSTRNHYPAIDVLESISRAMPKVCSELMLQRAAEVRRLLGIYADHEDLISIGAYHQGTNPEVDLALDMKSKIDHFLRQGVLEPSRPEETQAMLENLIPLTGPDVTTPDAQERTGPPGTTGRSTD